MRADQCADAVGTVVALDVAQTIGHVFEGGLPVHSFPLTALLEHGMGQAVSAIQGFVRETLAVSDPALVDIFVFQRHDAHDLVVLDLHDQVGTGRIVRSHRLATRQLPSAGVVAERLAGQSAHGADVDHVARQLGVNRLAQEGFDFGVFAPV